MSKRELAELLEAIRAYPAARRQLEAAESAGIPVVILQHDLPADAPIFAAGSATQQNLPEVAAHEERAFHRVSKRFSSVFAETGLARWLRERDVNTITLVGFMTNNCVLASAAEAEPLGFSVEVLSDATGAIDIANDAGHAQARQVHETLMALLHSNRAAVADTATWTSALKSGESLATGDLIGSAARGRTGE